MAFESEKGKNECKRTHRSHRRRIERNHRETMERRRPCCENETENKGPGKWERIKRRVTPKTGVHQEAEHEREKKKKDEKMPSNAKYVVFV